jgi:hypothetical protein
LFLYILYSLIIQSDITLCTFVIDQAMNSICDLKKVFGCEAHSISLQLVVHKGSNDSESMTMESVLKLNIIRFFLERHILSGSGWYRNRLGPKTDPLCTTNWRDIEWASIPVKYWDFLVKLIFPPARINISQKYWASDN